jgi:hypothetical protein
MESEKTLIIVKPLKKVQVNQTFNLQSKPKSVLLMSKGRTNLRLNLNQDGFNGIE